jgi:hypothetical protein
MLHRKPFITMVAAALLWLPGRSVVSQAAQDKPQAKDNSFNVGVAGQLLDQITAGLIGHNQKKMLSAFDVSKMPDGPLFRQQINAFFAQTDNIRVHYNILEVSMEGNKAMVEANVEVDADVREAITAPLRKQAKLHFVAENGAAGWKFTEVQPRAFFSTQP